MTIAGCETDRQNLAKTGQVNFKRETTGKVYVAWCSAYQEDGALLVTGVLRRRDTVGMSIGARVDVEIVLPDGKIMDEACSSVIRVPRRRIGRGQSFQRFAVRFPQMPPRGSLVHLVVESGVG